MAEFLTENGGGNQNNH